MSLDTILDTDPEVAAGVPVVSSLAFSPVERVRWTAGLFNRERIPERMVRFAPRESRLVDAAGNYRPSALRTIEFFGEDRLGIRTERVQVEGPRWRVEVAPGLVAVRNSDPNRSERANERAHADRQAKVAAAALRLVDDPDWREPDPAPQRFIRSWSPKSRSHMVQVMAELDYAPLLEAGDPLGMVTLTYPGEWLTVAPDSSVCHRHLLAFRKRFERRFKRPLVAVWKREFQRRGAPHYHLLMAVPQEAGFRAWVSSTWADVVGHPDPVQRERHEVAGTGVDLVEGSRYSDPKRAAVYFSKHGAFSAKEYQNEAPAEWDGSVGRFWGYWRLEKAVAAVEVAPDVARQVVRTARRYADANGYYTTVYRWRKVTTVDRETGELGWKWRKRRTKVKVRRLRRSSGYLVVNDGPAFAAQLARSAQLLIPSPRHRGRRPLP